MPDDQRYTFNLISAFGGQEAKSGFTGSIRLDAFHDFITGPHDDLEGTLLTVDQAYRRVPWVRRGVNLIARSVSHMPYVILQGGTDVTEQTPITERLLFVTQKSLEKYGRAYWLLEANRLGRNVTPRFIPAKSVKPKIDRERGLVGFTVQFSTGAQEFPLEQVVYFHVPSDESETDCDPAPLECVKEPASLLYAANRVASKFYAGGMMQTALVTVPQTTSDEEAKRVEGFFNRMTRGIRNAFRVLAVRAAVDVKVIGQSIKDARMPELIAEARDDVAVGLDIPPTVLDGKAANFATASSEWFGFTTNTVIPKAEFLEEVINAQYLSRLGLVMEIQPWRLEIMQAVQLEQAQAVMLLLNLLPGDSLIERDEARALVGFDAAPRKPAAEDEEGDEGEMPGDEAGMAKRMWLNWERAFAVADGRRNGKGIVAPNAPDDDRRRKREQEMQEVLESYFRGQRRRVVEDVGKNRERTQ